MDYETVVKDHSMPFPFHEIYEIGEYMHAFFTHRNLASFSTQLMVPRPRAMAKKSKTNVTDQWPDPHTRSGETAWCPRLGCPPLIDPLNADKDQDEAYGGIVQGGFVPKFGELSLARMAGIQLD